MPKRLATYWNLNRVPLLLSLAGCTGYGYVAYFLQRTDFLLLISLFVALFVCCFKLIQFKKFNFRFLLAVGLLFRVVFLMALPNLSQDFYRFVWDGQLVALGTNPYVYTPDHLMENGILDLYNAQELYNGMGALSARHFSNYPPLNQLFFAMAALLGGKSILGTVVTLRCMIMAADVGIVFFGRRLLKKLNMAPHLVFWYFLNPLVVLELTGNLHFEGVMLFFFVWALALLAQQLWQGAALVYACSIMVKLVPLLFLPLFLTYFGFKKSIFFYLLTGLACLVLFLPFYDPQFLGHYSETLRLWFSNFEFNAGLWNLIKKVGTALDQKPWELIRAYGKITPIVTVAAVLLFTFLTKKRSLNSLLVSMLWVLTLYYMISTTVHPWYVIFLVVLGIFTPFRFPLVWSAMAVLSYYAYGSTGFEENLWLLGLEYMVVIIVMVYEIFDRYNKNKGICKNLSET